MWGIDGKNWKGKLRELVLAQPDPHKVAMSLSIGCSAAFLPPFGFHTILVIAIASILKTGVPLAVLGTWINNPWTFIPIFLPAYVLEIEIGEHLLREETVFPSLRALSKMPTSAIIAQVKLVIWPFICGSVIVSLMVFLVTYLVSRIFLRFKGKISSEHQAR
jgi:hypothetical protein